MPLQKRILAATLLLLAILISSAVILGLSPIGVNSIQISKPTSMISDQDNLTDPLESTDKDVASSINNTPFFVLDFYYPGCGPCIFVSKIVSELSEELHGQIVFGRMNVQTNDRTVSKYKINSFPTLLFFNDGVLIDRIKGNTSKSALLADLKEFKSDLDTSKVRLQPASSGVQVPSGDIPLASFGEDKPSMPMPITDENIGFAVTHYPNIVIDASTTWCEWCKYMNATIRDLSGELHGQIAFGLMDMDKNNMTKNNYNITAYPTLLIFKEGKLAAKVVGNQQKSSFVARLKQIYPNLDTSNVRTVQPTALTQIPAKPKLTPEQVCANMTKSDAPLLEAYVVSRCPFGLQMMRIMAELVSKSPEFEKYLKVRYIGSISNNIITSMHGNEEAHENLREICIREEQPDKYWNYIQCYIKEGKSSDCLMSVSANQGELGSCINDTARGLAYAQKDFDLANKSKITGSPTLLMDGKTVSEFDFSTNTINGRSPEALKDLLCCGFNNKPSFCSLNFNRTQAITMFEVNAPTSAASQQAPGRDIPLINQGEVKPSQTMLIKDDTIASAESQYPLLVVVGFVNWCGFCKNLNVTISDLSRELQGRVAFGLIDMDRNNETKTTYNITSYPTILIFKDGKLADKMVGNQPKSSFAEKFKQIEPELNMSKVNTA